MTLPFDVEKLILMQVADPTRLYAEWCDEEQTNRYLIAQTLISGLVVCHKWNTFLSTTHALWKPFYWCFGNETDYPKTEPDHYPRCVVYCAVEQRLFEKTIRDFVTTHHLEHRTKQGRVWPRKVGMKKCAKMVNQLKTADDKAHFHRLTSAYAYLHSNYLTLCARPGRREEKLNLTKRVMHRPRAMYL